MIWWFLKKLNVELPYDPELHFWVYTQRYDSNISAHPWSTEHHSQQPKGENNPSIKPRIILKEEMLKAFI